MFEVCIHTGKECSACEFAAGRCEAASVCIGCHFQTVVPVTELKGQYHYLVNNYFV